MIYNGLDIRVRVECLDETSRQLLGESAVSATPCQTTSYRLVYRIRKLMEDFFFHLALRWNRPRGLSWSHVDGHWGRGLGLFSCRESHIEVACVTIETSR